MAHTRTEFGFERTACACSQCSSYCAYLPGALIPTDLKPISTRLGYDDVVIFATENLVASGGATVILNGAVTQIPTLTPRRTPEGACIFLRDNLCSIHAEAPYSCAFFDCSQDQRESNTRSLFGLKAIYQEWLKGGLYARLWMLLDSMGLVAPSAMEARERRQREMESKEQTSWTAVATEAERNRKKTLPNQGGSDDCSNAPRRIQGALPNELPIVHVGNE